MKIGVVGTSGAGKSTIASHLAKVFNLELLRCGDFIKKKSFEYGFNDKEKFFEWLDFLKENPRIEREIDKELIKICKEKERLVIDSWILPFLLEKIDLIIYVHCNLEQAAERIAKRERIPLKDAYDFVQRKNNITRERYIYLYHIDIFDIPSLQIDFYFNTSRVGKKKMVKIAEEIVRYWFFYE